MAEPGPNKATRKVLREGAFGGRSLDIDIDAEKVMETIGDMLDKLEGFYAQDMFEEFVEWQSADMKRKYPSMVPEPVDSIYTMVYPRSRLSKRRAKFAAKFFKMRQKGRRKAFRRIVAGKRPILRPILFRMLQQRMRNLMELRLRWR